MKKKFTRALGTDALSRELRKVEVEFVAAEEHANNLRTEIARLSSEVTKKEAAMMAMNGQER